MRVLTAVCGSAQPVADSHRDANTDWLHNNYLGKALGIGIAQGRVKNLGKLFIAIGRSQANNPFWSLNICVSYKALSR
jgi:hypothetical protein